MVEEVFQTGAEKINHEDIVQTFLTEIIDVGDASCSGSVTGPRAEL